VDGTTIYETSYFYVDNAQITNQGSGTNYNSRWGAESSDTAKEIAFQAFIKDPSRAMDFGSGEVYKPHNPESFLLISKGYDGVYGTEDDIVNWNK